MSIPESFLGAKYALIQGDDAEGRATATAEWKKRHVGVEWEDFSLSVCQDGCRWAEVLAALMETAPFGADRVVIVPHADHLLVKAKELPQEVKKILANPIDGTCLLLVLRGGACDGDDMERKANPLGAKPFSDWKKEGRVLSLGVLDSKGAVAFVESVAKILKMKMAGDAMVSFAERMGGDPGILTRGMEVLELMADGQVVTNKMIDEATFRIGEQKAFAWSNAWQKGDVAQALKSLRLAMDDDAAGSPVMLLGQARKEIERLCRYNEAKTQGKTSEADLARALDLTPNQTFLVGKYKSVLNRMGAAGLSKLVMVMAETDSDIKGGAPSQSPTPLFNLTLTLCNVWGGRY